MGPPTQPNPPHQRRADLPLDVRKACVNKMAPSLAVVKDPASRTAPIFGSGSPNADFRCRPLDPAPISECLPRVMSFGELTEGTIVGTLLAPHNSSVRYYRLTLVRVLKLLTDGTVLLQVMFPTGRAEDYTSVIFSEAFVHEGHLTIIKSGNIYMPVPVQVNTIATALYKVEDFIYDDTNEAALTIEGVRLLQREEEALETSGIYSQYECSICKRYTLDFHAFEGYFNFTIHPHVDSSIPSHQEPTRYRSPPPLKRGRSLDPHRRADVQAYGATTWWHHANASRRTSCCSTLSRFSDIVEIILDSSDTEDPTKGSRPPLVTATSCNATPAAPSSHPRPDEVPGAAGSAAHLSAELADYITTAAQRLAPVEPPLGPTAVHNTDPTAMDEDMPFHPSTRDDDATDWPVQHPAAPTETSLPAPPPESIDPISLVSIPTTLLLEQQAAEQGPYSVQSLRTQSLSQVSRPQSDISWRGPQGAPLCLGSWMTSRKRYWEPVPQEAEHLV
jgi:hypothetical protein